MFSFLMGAVAESAAPFSLAPMMLMAAYLASNQGVRVRISLGAYSSVAQWIERSPAKAEVVGSNPIGTALLSIRIAP